MNKTIVSIFIALGLLLIDTPDAAAHDKSWTAYRVPPHYRHETHCRDHGHALPVRASRMPRWLKEDRSFRHWYQHSRLQQQSLPVMARVVRRLPVGGFPRPAPT